jgi:hypothetical protein
MSFSWHYHLHLDWRLLKLYCFFLHKIVHMDFAMDFARLDSVLDRIALQRGVTADTILAGWLERRENGDSERWRQLDGIPCIIGGLTALLGKF